nr:MAG TPA: hypothetical protein [Caudoviricetes sp.]
MRHCPISGNRGDMKGSVCVRRGYLFANLNTSTSRSCDWLLAVATSLSGCSSSWLSTGGLPFSSGVPGVGGASASGAESVSS